MLPGALQPVQSAGHGGLGGPLQDGVERRVDAKAARGQLGLARQPLDLRPRVVGEVRPDKADRGVGPGDHALAERLRVVGLVDHLEVPHLAQDEVSTLAGAVGVLEGRVRAGGPDDPGQEGRLADGQPLDVLPEEAARRRPDSVDGQATLLAEVDVVQVGLEDRPLVVAPLEGEGEAGLENLPVPGASGGQDRVLHELLGQRAATLSDAAVPDVRPHGAQDGATVDAIVLEEPPILGREDRRDQMGRDGGEGDGLVEPSHAETAQDLRLQLDLRQAPPVGGADVDDASPVEAEARLEGRTGRARVVACPEGDVPLSWSSPRTRGDGGCRRDQPPRSTRQGGSPRPPRTARRRPGGDGRDRRTPPSTTPRWREQAGEPHPARAPGWRSDPDTGAPLARGRRRRRGPDPAGVGQARPALPRAARER